MDPLSQLADLGFGNAAIVGENPKQFVLRIRTSKGWVYEKFAKGAQGDIASWAAKHQPE